MAQKDFTEWNKKKQSLNSSNPNIYFHEREVWWCHLGLNIGFEQDGKHNNFSRPVVILKTYSTNAAMVVPLTTRKKTGIYFFDVGMIDGQEAKAVLSQVRFIDKRRLINKIDNVEENIFDKLRSAIIQVNLT